MKLLEYGKDASVFATRRPGNAQIRYGVLLVFLGIAFLVANQLHEAGVMDEEPAYFSMLSLGAGLALIIGHFLERHDLRNRKKNEEDQA